MKKGFTLIEIIIYTALLSFLVAGYVGYVFAIHEQDMKFLDKIHDIQ